MIENNRSCKKDEKNGNEPFIPCVHNLFRYMILFFSFPFFHVEKKFFQNIFSKDNLTVLFER